MPSLLLLKRLPLIKMTFKKQKITSSMTRLLKDDSDSDDMFADKRSDEKDILAHKVSVTGANDLSGNYDDSEGIKIILIQVIIE